MVLVPEFIELRELEVLMLLEKDKLKEYYLGKVKEKWLSASDEFPVFLSEISEDTKDTNKQYIQTIFNDFQTQVKGYSRLPFRHKRWKLKMLTLINSVLFQETVIGIHKALDLKELEDFQEELKEFLRHVRKFAPELTLDEVGQALRNYIVYAMFKQIHRSGTGFSMAGFGYSMLYPFTDNYIDCKDVTSEEKAEYNRIIQDKIEGRPVHPRTTHQKKTCDLLQAIESEYPRNTETSAFLLLSMMLEAQENSISQQQRGLQLTYEERLDISLYKGGVSVLIDRFFVRKDLNEEELILYLSLGFFLQLADDLQDIKTDSEQSYQTILTLDLSPEKEEKVINKLLNFVHDTMGSFQAENDTFKNFVLENCYQLIYTSLIGSKEFFSREYVDKIENYLPVKYLYYEEVKSGFFATKGSKKHDRYIKILDGVIFD
jgi:hypothetical protein